MKKKVFIFFIVCMLLPLCQLNLAYKVPSNDVRQSNQSYASQEISENITNISIENITGGIGVIVTLRNNGDVPLNAIQVTVTITKDFFVRLKNTVYTIPYLGIDDTTELHVRMFGIGLGILTPLPELTLRVKTKRKYPKRGAHYD